MIWKTFVLHAHDGFFSILNQTDPGDDTESYLISLEEILRIKSEASHI